MARTASSRHVPPAGLEAPRRSLVLLTAALILVALNLRTTVSSLPPLIPEIERDVGLSGPLAGVLTSLPVLCMAWLAPGAYRLAARIGPDALMLRALTLVAVGNGARLAGGNVAVLFAGTIVAGAGIAACGMLLPGIVKEHFPRRAGAATAAYTVAMMIGAASASVLAVPAEHALGSWRASLGSWLLPAAIAAAVWALVARRAPTHVPPDSALPTRLPWRSRPAWLLAGFLSLQASLAYAYIAWLAPAYEDRGFSAGTAGVLLGVLNVTQVVTAVTLPVLADRGGDRRPGLLAAGGCSVIGALWLFVAPGTLPWVATTVLGLGLGGGFSLAVVLVVDFAADPGASSRLAAMVFAISYSFAAATPVVVGALRDASGGYHLPFGLLALMAVTQMLVATRLGPRRHGTVG